MILQIYRYITVNLQYIFFYLVNTIHEVIKLERKEKKGKHF